MVRYLYLYIKQTVNWRTLLKNDKEPDTICNGLFDVFVSGDEDFEPEFATDKDVAVTDKWEGEDEDDDDLKV